MLYRCYVAPVSTFPRCHVSTLLRSIGYVPDGFGRSQSKHFIASPTHSPSVSFKSKRDYLDTLIKVSPALIPISFRHKAHAFLFFTGFFFFQIKKENSQLKEKDLLKFMHWRSQMHKHHLDNDSKSIKILFSPKLLI
jgi:hypothetical protein